MERGKKGSEASAINIRFSGWICGSVVWLNEATVWTILQKAVGEIIVYNHIVLNVPFCAEPACQLTKRLKWPDQRTTGRTGGLQTERSFSMKQNFWQSLDVVGLS